MRGCVCRCRSIHLCSDGSIWRTGGAVIIECHLSKVHPVGISIYQGQTVQLQLVDLYLLLVHTVSLRSHRR